MKVEVNSQDTLRGEAFELWMASPMPMVTLTKTFDVSRVLKMSKKLDVGFNALLCWCIVKAAVRMEVFYLLPEQGKLYKYDRLAVNVIVKNKKGGINSCDIPYEGDLKQFLEVYDRKTSQVALECKSLFLDDYMVVGTSAMIQTELDCIVNQYTDKFCNPMVMWGKYRKGLFGVKLPISFQFHHVQMDGGDGAYFLELLQEEIKKL